MNAVALAEASIHIPDVGLCHVGTEPIYDDYVESSSCLNLYLSESVQEIGTVSVKHMTSDGGVVRFSGLEVQEGFRGMGLGSLLTRKAVEFARGFDPALITEYAANERSLAAFCGNFDSEQLKFWKVSTKTGAKLGPEEIRQEEAEAFLERLRSQQSAHQLDSTDELQDFAVKVDAELV